MKSMEQSTQRLIVVGAIMYRNWNAQMAVGSNTLPFELWVKDVVSQWALNTSSAEDIGLRLLC
jgi:hypothetical protein